MAHRREVMYRASGSYNKKIIEDITKGLEHTFPLKINRRALFPGLWILEGDVAPKY